VTDLYELPDFCPLNRPNLNTFISKYRAASLAEKAQDVDDLRQNLIDARVGVDRALLTTSLISGADVSMPAFEPQDILNICCDINWPKHY